MQGERQNQPAANQAPAVSSDVRAFALFGGKWRELTPLTGVSIVSEYTPAGTYTHLAILATEVNLRVVADAAHSLRVERDGMRPLEFGNCAGSRAGVYGQPNWGWQLHADRQELYLHQDARGVWIR